MSSYRKDLDKLAKRYGFRVVGHRNNGHILLGNTEGKTITAAYSPRSPSVALKCTRKKLEEVLA